MTRLTAALDVLYLLTAVPLAVVVLVRGEEERGNVRWAMTDSVALYVHRNHQAY